MANKKVRCFFNQINVVEEPYEVDKDAPFIDLKEEIANEVCEELLEGGIIDSFIIPELCGKPVLFHTKII